MKCAQPELLQRTADASAEGYLRWALQNRCLASVKGERVVLHFSEAAGSSGMASQVPSRCWRAI